MNSICSGMEVLGLMGMIRRHHDLFEEVFVYSPKTQFNAQCLKELVSEQEGDFSNETLQWFYDYVDTCESKGTT